METTCSVRIHGDSVDFVTKRFLELKRDFPHMKFKMAIFHQDLSKIDPDVGKNAHYPLVIHTTAGIAVYVAEVRSGQNDEKAMALMRILTGAKFHLSPAVLDAILHSDTASFTLWNESVVHQY